MTLIINIVFLIFIILLSILAISNIKKSNLLESRSEVVAKKISEFINGQIKPQKYYFELIGYKVIGTYQENKVTVHLHQELVSITIYISHKLPKQKFLIIHIPKHTGDIIRVRKDFTIYLKKPDIIKDDIFSSEKFETYLKKLLDFIDSEKSKTR